LKTPDYSEIPLQYANLEYCSLYLLPPNLNTHYMSDGTNETPKMAEAGTGIRPSIAPWLTVRDSLQAIAFYQAAFGATEVYRLDVPDGGPVVRLAVNGAEFWVSEENMEAAPLGGGSVRMILTVKNPDTLFAQALQAGASEIFPVGEGHGWRLGRLADPFGLHWEIGHPLKAGI
jgi:PhnB protein